jgi:hypothetical protein
VRINTATAAGDLTVTGVGVEIATGDAGGTARVNANTGNAALGVIRAQNGDVVVSAANIAAEGLSGGRDVTTTSTDATRVTTLTAGRDGALQAGGALAFTTATTGRDLTGRGSTLTATTATAGGDASLQGVNSAVVTTLTAAGDASVLGADVTVTTASAGGTARIEAGPDGAATLGTVDASRGDVLVRGGTVTAQSLTAGRDVDVQGRLLARATTVRSGSQDVRVSAGVVELGTVTSGRDATIIGGDSNTVNSLTAARDGTLSGGAISFGVATTGGDLAVRGRSVAGGTANVGRDATLASTAGNTDVGSLTVARNLSVEAAGQARIANLNSTGAGAQLVLNGTDVVIGAVAGQEPGDAQRLTLNAASPGSLTINASNDATVNVSGPARLTALNAGRDVTVAARNGEALVGSASAGRAIDVSAQNGSARLRSATLGAGGTSINVRATGAAGDAVLGADGVGAGSGERLTAPTTAAIRVQGDRDATVSVQNGFSVNALTAGRNALAASTQGDVRVGQASGGRTVTAQAVQGWWCWARR